MRERGLLERDVDADVPGRRIDSADEGNHRDEDEMLQARERNTIKPAQASSSVRKW